MKKPSGLTVAIAVVGAVIVAGAMFNLSGQSIGAPPGAAPVVAPPAATPVEPPRPTAAELEEWVRLRQEARRTLDADVETGGRSPILRQAFETAMRRYEDYDSSLRARFGQDFAKVYGVASR
jgi:hypothetical protein